MRILALTTNWRQARFRRERKLWRNSEQLVVHALFAATIFAVFFCPIARAQQTDPAKPVVIQPGAPGAPSKTLPPSTRATLPARSTADVDFMQGMILHHAQAVEMTAMIPSHTQNEDLRSLGARISSSQSDEIKFMKRWLAARGESVPTAMGKMPGMDMSHDASHGTSKETSHETSHETFHEGMALMPGMLTPQQMEALWKAKGAEFDHLFLLGMIQHHNGALTMVKDLFDTAGAGQDAELFDFATDADNTQRAEIRIMETMLKKETFEEKR
ncbi:MAG TPA: DUF305 domain-containing protein [Candidatus Deferrimicrobiaceae bacterium]|jgi:uncharacterized protein (DUF305 family)|nr:DUF305 domain-containing protein [Candidatus Deferrimicrobiaceae bacterium]